MKMKQAHKESTMSIVHFLTIEAPGVEHFVSMVMPTEHVEAFVSTLTGAQHHIATRRYSVWG